ncbi:MAG: hypothetical protein AABZ02_07680 [Bacteroidota bacterium]
MAGSRPDGLSRETKIAIFASLLLHIAVIAALAILRLRDGAYHPQLVVTVESQKGTPCPSREIRAMKPRAHISHLKKAPTGEPVLAKKPIVDVPPQEDKPVSAQVVAPESTSAPLPHFTLRPNLTYSMAESLSQLYPELKQFLLKEALALAVLRDDAAYCAWHDSYVAAISSLNLPGELEGAARLNQQRFGTPYNPLRGPQLPNQVDILAILKALIDAGRAVVGK